MAMREYGISCRTTWYLDTIVDVHGVTLLEIHIDGLFRDQGWQLEIGCRRSATRDEADKRNRTISANILFEKQRIAGDELMRFFLLSFLQTSAGNGISYGESIYGVTVAMMIARAMTYSQSLSVSAS